MIEFAALVFLVMTFKFWFFPAVIIGGIIFILWLFTFLAEEDEKEQRRIDKRAKKIQEKRKQKKV